LHSCSKGHSAHILPFPSKRACLSSFAFTAPGLTRPTATNTGHHKQLAPNSTANLHSHTTMASEITSHDQDQSPSLHDDGNGIGLGDGSRGTKRQRAAQDDDDDDDDKPGRERRKIEIKFIQDKSRRHITFSKRKAGIMKKVRHCYLVCSAAHPHLYCTAQEPWLIPCRRHMNSPS